MTIQKKDGKILFDSGVLCDDCCTPPIPPSECTLCTDNPYYISVTLSGFSLCSGCYTHSGQPTWVSYHFSMPSGEYILESTVSGSPSTNCTWALITPWSGSYKLWTTLGCSNLLNEVSIIDLRIAVNYYHPTTTVSMSVVLTTSTQDPALFSGGKSVDSDCVNAAGISNSISQFCIGYPTLRANISGSATIADA